MRRAQLPNGSQAHGDCARRTIAEIGMICVHRNSVLNYAQQSNKCSTAFEQSRKARNVARVVIVPLGRMPRHCKWPRIFSETTFVKTGAYTMG